MSASGQNVVAGVRWGEADTEVAAAGVQTRLIRLASLPAPRLTPERLVRLVRTIETDIVPRLVLAVRPMAASDDPAVVTHSVHDLNDIADFATIVLTCEVAVVAARLRERLEAGATLEVLYLRLLAPVARRLGEMWEQDSCSFADVTVAVGRLQQVVLEFAGQAPLSLSPPTPRRRVLFAPVPGEQHTFGLLMVGDFFRRAGWDVWSQPASTRGDLVALVRREWFAVVALSASSETSLGALAASIRVIRRASANHRVGVLVGGLVFTTRPDLATRVGADATAADAQEATAQAERLMTALAGRN